MVELIWCHLTFPREAGQGRLWKVVAEGRAALGYNYSEGLPGVDEAGSVGIDETQSCIGVVVGIREGVLCIAVNSCLMYLVVVRG